MTTEAPAPFPGAGASARSGWFRRRARRDADDRWRLAQGLAWAWRDAAIGAGVGRSIATVSGPTEIAPKVTRVSLGPPTTLTVQLLPGQLVTDLRRAAPRLAPHLGATALRIESRGLAWAVVTLLDADPLGDTYRTPGGDGPALIGMTEAGPLHVDPVELPHIIAQGSTRSGKSTWTYGLLGQLAHHPDVRITGVDASGITLRPFAADELVVCGLADPARIERVLAELVDNMDARTAAMPLDVDVLPTDDTHPLAVVVLEEWPGTLRALDTLDAKLGKRVRALVARLLAEGHKVGYRVLVLCQRAEATIVGAAERAQCAGRLSFRVDSAEAVKLLHSGAEDLAADHAAAPPGIALLSWPGRPLTRLRAPMTTYAEYARRVAR